jgi:sec-independent protein translocase protein TatA
MLRPRRATPLEVSMPGKLGLPEILLILAVALLIFGPSKLADLGKGLGEGIKNFKSSIKEGDETPGEKKS